MVAPIPSFTSSSLYVGDLNPDVTEAILFELFNNIGPIASIRVCRDAITRRSLGYAYVNFRIPQDAERAINAMNFTVIHERTCRIMWCQRDPGMRKSGAGNIFIKNLAPEVGKTELENMFKEFGVIKSAVVMTDTDVFFDGRQAMDRFCGSKSAKQE